MAAIPCPEIDRSRPPPCPCCINGRVTEQAPVAGTTYLWFHCHNCGHIWNEPLRSSH